LLSRSPESGVAHVRRAVEEYHADITARNAAGQPDDEGWSRLTVEHRNADTVGKRGECADPGQPLLCCPRLPGVAAPVLAFHGIRGRNSDRVEVEASDAAKIPRRECLDRGGLSGTRGAGYHEDGHDAAHISAVRRD
jgi:hypothetical protein